MSQLIDLHWHTKLHLNYQFGAYADPLASVHAAAICHSDMLRLSGLLTSGPEAGVGGGGVLMLTWLFCNVFAKNQWQSCTDVFSDSQESGKQVYKACGWTHWLVIRQYKKKSSASIYP